MLSLFLGEFFLNKRKRLLIFLFTLFFVGLLMFVFNMISVNFISPKGEIKNVSIVDPILCLFGYEINDNNRIFMLTILFGLTIFITIYKIVSNNYIGIYVLGAATILSIVFTNGSLFSNCKAPPIQPQPSTTYNIVQLKQPDMLYSKEFEKFTPLLEDVKKNTNKEDQIPKIDTSKIYEQFLTDYKEFSEYKKEKSEKKVEKPTHYSFQQPKKQEKPPPQWQQTQPLQTYSIPVQTQSPPQYYVQAPPMAPNIQQQYQNGVPLQSYQPPPQIYTGDNGNSYPIIFHPGYVNNPVTQPPMNGYMNPSVNMRQMFPSSISPGIGASVPYVIGNGRPNVRYINSITSPPSMNYNYGGYYPRF